VRRVWHIGRRQRQLLLQLRRALKNDNTGKQNKRTIANITLKTSARL
jgi:hypothetical protein